MLFASASAKIPLSIQQKPPNVYIIKDNIRVETMSYWFVKKQYLTLHGKTIDMINKSCPI